MSKERNIKKPTFTHSVLTMAAIIAIIIPMIKANPQYLLVPALMIACVIAGISAYLLGYKYEDIEEYIIYGIKNGLGAVLILVIIGAVIAAWLSSGTMQTLIYYGLQVLKPEVLLPVGFLLCSLTSLLIGSSFGTIATMGIVIMGVGQALGFNPLMLAGCVISGAMFGDKVSPMSDSTNLTAAMTSTPLFDHVKSMLYVSLPAVVISVAIYWFQGMQVATSGGADFSLVENMSKILLEQWNISPLTLIPPIIVLVLSVMQVPAILSLMISLASAVVMSMLLQNAGIMDVLLATNIGYKIDLVTEGSAYFGSSEAMIEAAKYIQSLVNKGGVISMLPTVSIILTGTAMGGILERSGILQTILDSMMKVIKKPAQLIIASLFSGYLMLIATGEMYVSIIVPGRTLEPAYKEMGIDNSVLSRSMETSATLACGVLPWGVAALFAMSILDVGIGYVQYCYLPFLAPIIAIIYAVTGFATFPAKNKKVEA